MRASLKLFTTSTFRLAALYLFLFVLSVAALLAYVYWNTAVLLERQTDETIRAEVQALADQYRLRGFPGIVDTIARRSRDETGSIYLLANPQGNRIAGNIDRLPAEAVSESDWIEFPLNVTQGGFAERHMARAFHTDLAGTYDLIVGRDVQALRQFAVIIRSSLIGAIGIAVVLGLGGGLLMSRNFLRRVDAITAASRTIMGGNMQGRMPVSGSGDELDRLAQSLNEMLDRIERLMAGMQEVSSNVAHDLRTPLTRIKARLEGVLRAKRTAGYREALEKTVEDADRLLATFNALLSITRAEAGQSRAGFASLDASSIIADVAELYEPMAEEYGGSLTTQAPAGLTVFGDRQLLSQAVSNLVDNAIKYGAENGQGPQIAITGAPDDGNIVLTVSDRGPGIAPSDRERAVERFVRLDGSRSKPGIGLGLSLVSGVMKLHDGKLVLDDHAPGLSANLVLPRAEISAPSKAAAAKS